MPCPVISTPVLSRIIEKITAAVVAFVTNLAAAIFLVFAVLLFASLCAAVISAVIVVLAALCLLVAALCAVIAIVVSAVVVFVFVAFAVTALSTFAIANAVVVLRFEFVHSNRFILLFFELNVWPTIRIDPHHETPSPRR